MIPDEKHDTLRDALTKLIIGLHPLNGPRAVIRVDPAPGFSSLSNNDSLGHFNVSIDVGRIKNKNHNPVAEKAVRELVEELLRQQPGGGPVGEVGLALATARLNSRLRFSGLSSLELWTQRNQFTHEQLPLSDYQLILDRHKHRSTNHAHSKKSKNPRGLIVNTPPLQVGDIVYLFSDKDKSRARDRYVVVSIDTPWCFVKKFRGSQLRATSYKVKLSECYSVPSSVIVSSPPSHPSLPDMNDEPPVTPAVFPPPVHPMLAPLHLQNSSPFRLTRSKSHPSPGMTHHLIPPVAHLPQSLYKMSQAQALLPQISQCCLLPTFLPSLIQDLKGSADLLHTCRIMLDSKRARGSIRSTVSSKFTLSQDTTRD